MQNPHNCHVWFFLFCGFLKIQRLTITIPVWKTGQFFQCEREGRTGEYWHSAVAVRTLRTWASSVSKVVYYMALCDACFSFYIKCFQIFRIVKLAWRMFVFFIHLRNVGKNFLLASSGSFTVKNDNFHSFFFLFFFAGLVANFEFAALGPKKRYTGWTVSIETVRTKKSWSRKNQSEHRDLPKTGFAI